MKTLIALLLLLISSFCAYSDKIYFKNGDILTGTVLQSDRTTTTIETAQGNIEVETNSIERIDYADKEETETSSELSDSSSFYKVNNSAFIWRPLPTLVSALSGYFDIVLEGQTAFDKNWAGTAIVEFGSLSGLTVTSFQIGPQYRPFGTYLNGFLVGVYPGFGYVTDYYDWVWFFSGTVEVGYEWILRSRIVLGATTGFSYITMPLTGGFKFNISAHIGWAMPDLLMKAK